MISAVLFDIDGTLLDHKSAQEKALNEYAATCSEDIDNINKFISCWEYASGYYFDKYVKGEITFKRIRSLRAQYVFKQFDVLLSEREAYERFMRYMEFYERHWSLYSDVLACLKELKGIYKLGIISNGGSRQQRRKLAHMGIDKYFCASVISEDIGVAKPNQIIFNNALENLGLEADEVVYVGDDEKADIEGAKAVGIHAVFLCRYGEDSPAAADAVITSLQELKETVIAI
ncbi:MAG: HAD family hydrolase [Candidatus Methanofastidiosia archaeon]